MGSRACFKEKVGCFKVEGSLLLMRYLERVNCDAVRIYGMQEQVEFEYLAEIEWCSQHSTRSYQIEIDIQTCILGGCLDG